MLLSSLRFQVKSPIWLRFGMHSTTDVLMWLASVEVPVEPLHANKAPHGCIFPRLETSTVHRTEHFPMGWVMRIAALLPTPMSPSFFPPSEDLQPTVTVARFLFFCSRAPEQRASHSESVAPRKVQGDPCSGSCCGSLRRPRN